MSARRREVSILAFEVATTIDRCSMLLKSLSPQNTHFLKMEILHSHGVQNLVSTDIQELLSIAAADKREEFDSLCLEVTRYGDYCKDWQWHNLGRFFSELFLDPTKYESILNEDAEMSMIKLDALSHPTWELYYHLNALDILEKDYRRILVEMENVQLSRKAEGESIIVLRDEIKHQRKLVKSLKKKSVWSRSLEEVVEDLVDIVIGIRQEIFKAFGDKGFTINLEPTCIPEKLGVAGLDLHYANIIILIDNIASRPTSLSANMRNTLYHWLPTCIKSSLSYKLGTVKEVEMLTPQIKGELEKVLQWLVPLAFDTITVHQGFHKKRVKGPFDSNEIVERKKPHMNIMRLQTLYHADKIKIDTYIIELLNLALWAVGDDNLKLAKVLSFTSCKYNVVSDGVQHLVSTDIQELLSIAAADKREELYSLCREVTRYGDFCKNPQWHNLNRFFEGLEPDPSKYEKLKKDAEMSMIKLDSLSQPTWELYYHLSALEILAIDYNRRLVEMDNVQVSRKVEGKNLTGLRGELKNQRKLVKSLKKKSVWSRSLEEVVEDFFVIVIGIHQEIFKAFGDKGLAINVEPTCVPEKLGVAYLALHYANIITLINDIASRPTSLSANMRNTLYRRLPTCIKSSLAYKLRRFEGVEMLTIPQIKDELEKVLRWLVPLASNTIKAHQGFHKTRGTESFDRNEIVGRTKSNMNIIRLQTLYHAGKDRIDTYIIELLVWLHCLICQMIGSSSWYAATMMIE